MTIILIERDFSPSSETDTIAIDLDKCSTPEEIKLKEEIYADMNSSTDDEYHYSQSSLAILSGRNGESHLKLAFLKGDEPFAIPAGSTIQYGPIVQF